MHPKNCQNRGNALPSRNHQNGTLWVGRAAAEPTTRIVHGHARERNAKQNAPRAIGGSNWRSVVRFALRFSRARARAASAPARPHVQFKARPRARLRPKTQGYQIPLSFSRVSAAPAGLEHRRLYHRRSLCTRERPGESSQMRAGGTTDVIWDDSARRFRESASRYRREGVPLM